MFKARDIKSKQIFAIKFLELNQTTGNEVESIVNEINIMKETIECPFVVEYLDYPFSNSILQGIKVAT